eukprot:TRINITY_DN4273_c0_g2_i1.p1 TRINITY_DN4273_c0_g2~~TRINITY_DN4273_c0_g2_i1.p1  ORF type:complete len:309 (+),score=40.22 TRINITY_DN4273_c0_g2_i1:46-972(+)
MTDLKTTKHRSEEANNIQKAYRYIGPLILVAFVLYDSLVHLPRARRNHDSDVFMLLTYHDSSRGSDEHGSGAEDAPYKTLVASRIPYENLAILRGGMYEIPEAVYKTGGLSVSSLPGEKVSMVVVNPKGNWAGERVTYYNSKSGSNANDGSSWDKAKRTLKGAVGGRAILARGAYWLGNGDFTRLIIEASDGCVLNFVGSYPDMPLPTVTQEDDLPYSDSLAQLRDRRLRMISFRDRTGVNPFTEEPHIRETFVSSGMSFQSRIVNYRPVAAPIVKFNRYLQIEDLVLKSAEELVSAYMKEHPEVKME